MGNLAIYFSDSEKYGYPFNKTEYLESYSYLVYELEKRGHRVYIVRGGSYLGTGRFESAYTLKAGVVTECNFSIDVDLIFNRDDKNTIGSVTDCNIINSPEFDGICVDKLITSNIFDSISPKTFEASDYLSLKRILCLEFEGRDFVLKPKDGSEGRGVKIFRHHDEVGVGLYDSWKGILIQEFLDTSLGIPGLCDTYHDLRVTIVNGDVVHSMLRMPSGDSLVSNISCGGVAVEIDLLDIPIEVIRMVRVIDSEFSKFNTRLYSIDLGLTSTGYKLFELNSRPGLGHKNFYKNYIDLNNEIVKMLDSELLCIKGEMSDVYN